MASGKILSYDELLEKYPDWVVWKADLYYRESTPEATEKTRLRTLACIGYAVKFIQDNGLTHRIISDNAPEIPGDLWIYLKDITPEGYEFVRTGYEKWFKRFERNMDADPSDIRILEKSLTQMRAKKSCI